VDCIASAVPSAIADPETMMLILFMAKAPFDRPLDDSAAWGATSLVFNLLSWKRLTADNNAA
jgi:hypothetical protein